MSNATNKILQRCHSDISIRQCWHFTRVKLWFCPAQWVKPDLNQIKLGLSGQNWVQHNNVHYVSSTFLPSDPVASKQYSALYLIFHSITYPQIDLKWIDK